MEKNIKKYNMLLICSIVLIMISLAFFIFTVSSVYDTLIIHLALRSTDYFDLSSVIKSISTDELENIDIAICNLELIRSTSNTALLSRLLNMQITSQNMEIANKAYEYLIQRYDEIKSGNIRSEELSVIAESLEKAYSIGYINLGNYIYKYNGNVLKKCYFFVVAIIMNSSNEYNFLCKEFAKML